MQSRTAPAYMKRSADVCSMAPSPVLLARHSFPLLASITTARGLGAKTRLPSSVSESAMRHLIKGSSGQHGLVQCASHAGSTAARDNQAGPVRERASHGQPGTSSQGASLQPETPFQTLSWPCPLRDLPAEMAAALQLDKSSSAQLEVQLILVADPEYSHCLDHVDFQNRQQMLACTFYPRGISSGQWRLNTHMTSRTQKVLVPTWLKNLGLQWTQRYKASPAQPGSAGPCQLLLQVRPAPLASSGDGSGTSRGMVEKQSELQWQQASYEGNSLTQPAVRSLRCCHKSLCEALGLPDTVSHGAPPRLIVVRYRAAPGSEAAMEAKGLKVPDYSSRKHTLKLNAGRWDIKPFPVNYMSGPTKGMAWNHWFAVEQAQGPGKVPTLWLQLVPCDEA
ncbi:hypothetical protein V8C86DRAFT_1621441 [Haematococcus lacustris]